MPNAHPQDSANSHEPDAITEALPQIDEIDSAPEHPDDTVQASDDASEVFTLANGYEYVTADSGLQKAVIDADDDSLALGLMKNGEEVEKLTRQERRADRFAERMAAIEKARAEDNKQRIAQEAALGRDALAPVTPLIQEEAGSRKGSKFFFIGSAVVTAAAIVTAATFLLPEQDRTSQPVSGTSATPSTATSVTQSSAPVATPTPSFNTQTPTVTEKENTTDLPVTPGTIQYAPTLAPVDEATDQIAVEEPLPEPAITVEVAPTEGEETPVEPSESPSAPAEIVPPTDAAPVDEPERPVETPTPIDSPSAVAEETTVAPSIAPVETPAAVIYPSEPAIIKLP